MTATLERTTLRVSGCWPAVAPLPSSRPSADLHHDVALDPALPADLRARAATGTPPTLLPYRPQDRYDRRREPLELEAVVLADDRLRATVLPALGGRLWSLRDRASGQELLARPQVLQPANLALRDAWVSGGVEWNPGTIGHSPLTFEPWATDEVVHPDGYPVLRLSAFERLREVVVQLDLSLPPEAGWLHVHGRVSNPTDRDVPMYWWSNVAVPERDDTRVLAPATSSFHLGAERILRRVPFPLVGGTDRDGDDLDASYPARLPAAADHFLDVGGVSAPWIVAVDAEGSGLGQRSTAALRGRKLFAWGDGVGGRRWQRWLGHDPERYLEIQAGWLPTQLEHEVLPAGRSRSWLEVYGPVQLGGAAQAGWDEAVAAAQATLDVVAPGPALEQRLRRWSGWVDQAPRRRLVAGDGWGALEERRREVVGDRPLDVGGTPFPRDELGADQGPWRRLLEEGRWPDEPDRTPPVSGDWAAQLEVAPASATTWLHRGHQAARAGDDTAALRAYDRSVALSASAAGLSARAAVRLRRGETTAAATDLERAAVLAPDDRTIVTEAVTTLLEVGATARAQRLLDTTSVPATDGRLQALRARAALALGDLPQAHRLLAEVPEVADLREGEPLLSALWDDLWVATEADRTAAVVDDRFRAWVRATHPLPEALDFRLDDTTPVPVDRPAPGPHVRSTGTEGR